MNKTTGHAPSTLMLERMRVAATDLAILATTTQGWKFTNERNGTMLYEMAGRHLPQNVTTARKFGRGAGHSSDYFLVRAVTTVHSGVAPMLDLLHSSTTDEFRLVMRQVFKDYFQNGVTLDKLTCTTPPPFAEDPDAGVDGSRRSFSEDDAYSVNWLTLKAQATLSTADNHRDFTLVCYQDAFLQSGAGKLERVGRGTARARSNTLSNLCKTVGVHVLSSVNFQDAPQLLIPDCTDRLHFRNSGFVIEETSEPNVLRLSLLLSLLPTKVTLKYARKYQQWLQSLASCVGNLARMLRPEVTIHCMSKLTWKQSDHCFMCLKMFRTFRRCHHCRFCGEAVCSACSSMINMSGYEIKDGSTSALTTSAVASALPSQHNEAKYKNSSRTGNIWQIASIDDMGTSRNTSRNSRTYREARGCSACIADLRYGVTTSAAMQTQRNSDSRSHTSGDNPLSARSRNGLNANFDADDVISFDSSDDVSYDRRLGSVATYIPARDGPGAFIEQIGPFTASTLGLIESVDDFPVTLDEMQDTFPPVDEATPPRFRTVSDPDQLRRMRNVSDPDLPQRCKDKHSLVSMSTASSSFSRSSNDRPTNDNVSHCLRSTYISTMSDDSSAGDLSRDPDILALAGLSMKIRPLDEFDGQTYGQASSQMLKESDREREDETNATSQRKDSEIEGKNHPTYWPGSSRADCRCRSKTTSSRDKHRLNTLRPADILRHRSLTSMPVVESLAATGSLSSTKNDSNTKQSIFASSSNVLFDEAKRPTGSSDSSSNGQYDHSKTSCQHSSITAAITAKVAATSANSAARERILPSNDMYTRTSTRQNLGPTLLHGLPIPNLADISTTGRNDIIPLSRPKQLPVNFVVFSDSSRESIFKGAYDGQDMIPLDF